MNLWTPRKYFVHEIGRPSLHEPRRKRVVLRAKIPGKRGPDSFPVKAVER